MNVSSSRWQFYVIPDLKTWSTHAANAFGAFCQSCRRLCPL